MWQQLKEMAGKLGDQLTARTGWAAMRVPLDRGSGRNQVTLPIPGYQQLNSYACGAICAAMIVRHFHPARPFGAIYAAIEPDPDLGANMAQVKDGLLECGLEVSSKRHLKFADICRAIDEGKPLLVSIRNPGAAFRHWVVLYGYGKRPDCVFVAGNNVPWITPNKVPHRQFEAIWQPKGNGLICARRTHRPRPLGFPKKIRAK